MMALLFLLSLLWAVSTSFGQQIESGVCGADTFLDESTNECICNSNLPEDPTKIYLAGIFDTSEYTWGPDVFAVTVKLINEGRWDALGEFGQTLEYTLVDSHCDETAAARAYWELRTLNNNRPPNGIVGARCSGASISLARISGLEGVPQLSPASNSARLTDEFNFPFFSRLVAPNNEQGEVGAMKAMLREFGWERVTILATDTQFAKDLDTEFKKAWAGQHLDDSGEWVGEVVHSDTIRITTQGEVDPDSVQRVLNGVPTDDPANNSRIIVLLAHNEHAYEVLEAAAAEQSVQPDTIWVGPSAWVARVPPQRQESSLPSVPGYLGVSVFRNRDAEYQSFLAELQQWQTDQGKFPVLEELPTFAAETVDSIVAITKAISSMSPENQRDGTEIVQRLRQLDFNGVSGRVQFTPEGDRKDAQFSIFNAQNASPDGNVIWTEVGTTGVEVGTTNLTSNIQDICFGDAGCGLLEAPGDSYPVPPATLPAWVIVMIVIPVLFLVFVSFKYWRSHVGKIRTRKELEAFRDSVAGMRAAKYDYIPLLAKKDVAGDIEQAMLSGVVDVAPIETVQWCWRETAQCMDQHLHSDIFGNPTDCWIRYDKDTSDKLEAAHQKDPKGSMPPLPGYSVNFATMKQTKLATGFERCVQRVVEKVEVENDDDEQKQVDLGQVEVGDEVPADLAGEPLMVLVAGDVIQISKQRDDKWAFGTKLHHADEAVARQLVKVATGAAKEPVDVEGPVDVDDADNNESVDDEEVSFLTDTGWFQLSATEIPSIDDLAALKKTVGDTGALDPPPYWDPVANPTVVQQHEIKHGHEYDAVVNAFKSTLANKSVKVIKVTRIQNLAMWQSYVVKRQTICYRETGHQAGDNDDEVQRKALERFERRWLWHGSNVEVLDKILQQGFNRSFCGKNATAYGKGVYFARDASYSSSTTYSVPDRSGNQYMLACRVVVGEYCRGQHNALTPDVRDRKTQSLYDTTVGLIGRDTLSNPSIYVTYHDAQAYPEYLITFKQ